MRVVTEALATRFGREVATAWGLFDNTQTPWTANQAAIWSRDIKARFRCWLGEPNLPYAFEQWVRHIAEAMQ